MQPYDVRGASYLSTLQAWVDNGARPTDHSLVDMASGIVNRGCHDAPFEGSGGIDPCGNGPVHAAQKRRKNFAYFWQVLEPLIAASGARRELTHDGPSQSPLGDDRTARAAAHPALLAKATALEA